MLHGIEEKQDASSHVRECGIALGDLIDVDRLDHLLDRFSETLGVATQRMTPSVSEETEDKWLCDLCPATKCRHTDRSFHKSIRCRPWDMPQCVQGVNFGRVRIMIGPACHADLILGPVLFDKVEDPDLIAVPLMDRDRFTHALDFIHDGIDMIVERGMANVKNQRVALMARQSEERLKRNMNFTYALLDAIPTPVFYKDRTGRYQGCNRAYTDIMGVSAEELRGKTVHEVWPSKQADTYFNKDLELMRHPEHQIYEYEVVDKYGKTRPVIFAKDVYRDENGEVAGLVGAFLDITARRQAEKALEKRIIALTRPLDHPDVAIEDLFNLSDLQQFQDQLAQAMDVASIITRPDGTPITVPSNFSHLCENIIHKTGLGQANCQMYAALSPKSDGPTVRLCPSGVLLNAGASITVGDRHVANWLIGQVRDRDQPEETFRAYARLIGVDEELAVKALRDVPAMSRKRFDQMTRMLQTFANHLSTYAYQNVQQARFITDLKRAEERLRKSETRFRDLADMLPEAVFEMGPDFNLTYANRCAYQIFHYCMEDMTRGLNALDMIAPSDHERAKVNLARRMAGEHLGAIEYTAQRSDGTVFPALIHIHAVESKGTVTGFRGVIVDMTDQKRIEQERVKLEADLMQSQKVESIGRLAGGVAHDLNNLLSPILGYAELLLNEIDDSVTRESLMEIRCAGVRARDLVRQLLAFSRKQTLTFLPVDLNKTIMDFKKLLRRTIREDVLFKLKLTHEISTIMADIGQIEQVIMNLAVNAADAMPHGGTLTIETGSVMLDDTSEETHLGVKPGPCTVLTISDTGHGMDAETCRHVFEPFFSTKKEFGTGLGMATVHGVVKQHGGCIRLFSKPGAGATFKIYLPGVMGMDDDSVVERHEFHVRAELGGAELGGHETILLAEDNEHVRRLMSDLLNRHGYNVLSAQSGSHALSLLTASQDPVHLLITDVIMPEMSGKDLYARARDIQPDLNVLYMSGYADDILDHSGILEHKRFFIQKPFTVQALAGIVREVLDRTGSTC